MSRALGRKCRKCGADEWYISKGRASCVPCQRVRAETRRKKRPEYHREWRAKNMARSLLYSAKNRARTAGVPCTITVEDIEAVWPADGRCPALGVELVIGRDTMGPCSPTLDRIVPSLGYVPGNIAVISFRANTIKADATTVEVLAVGEWMNRMHQSNS